MHEMFLRVLLIRPFKKNIFIGKLSKFKDIELAHLRVEERRRYNSEISKLNLEHERELTNLIEKLTVKEEVERSRLKEREKVCLKRRPPIIFT